MAKQKDIGTLFSVENSVSCFPKNHPSRNASVGATLYDGAAIKIVLCIHVDTIARIQFGFFLLLSKIV